MYAGYQETFQRDHTEPQAFDYPFVRAFAAGRFAAVAGYQIISVAVGWQLYEQTGQAWALGLVGLFEAAPVLLLMAPAGHAADRFPRRRVGMLAHGGLALAAAGLAVRRLGERPRWRSPTRWSLASGSAARSARPP